MDRAEARALLTTKVEQLRRLSYEQLRARVEEGPSFLGVTFVTRGEWEVEKVIGPSGATYELEVNVFWDDKKGANLRVMVALDDVDDEQSVRHSMVADFILDPDGAFLDE